ncbi:MAG: glycosyltransferase family 2 protein [Rhodocyclales bacterium]|nr:glycosyltransferase family 2 protein [Rhodocyclales bacterium]
MNSPAPDSISTPRLSVCIPVYNFGAFIGETLNSVLGQAVATPIEIVILDGASTDDTESVVRHYALRDPRLVYHRMERKGGIDFDMAESIRRARGDHCWLFSGDDVMRPGSLERVLELVADGPDLVLGKHSNCDKAMNFLNVHPVFRDERPFDVNLADTEARRAYFANCFNTEGLLSFMSGLVIKRATWLSVPDPEPFMGSCWAHAARAFWLATTRQSFIVRFVPEVLLDKRGENDSFLDKGVVHRIKIAVDGYASIVGHYFGSESFELSQVPRILLNETNAISWLHAKHKAYLNPSVENLTDLLRMHAYCHVGARHGWLKVLAFRASIKPILLPAAAMRFWLRRRYGI